MCKARLGICWDPKNPKDATIKYCKRNPVKDGYCTQHYKIHIEQNRPNTKYVLISRK